MDRNKTADQRGVEQHRRRVLRLGALLFRLKYYMQAPEDIATHTYRYSPDTYVRVVGEAAHVVADGREEVMSLGEAIERCKAALEGSGIVSAGAESWQ